jgi:hypothetical protein
VRFVNFNQSYFVFYLALCLSACSGGGTQLPVWHLPQASAPREAKLATPVPVPVPVPVAEPTRLPPALPTKISAHSAITPALPAATQALPAPPASATKAQTMQEFRVEVAKKILFSNIPYSFRGELPDPLASIPVIEISLNEDGTIRSLEAVRTPRFHPETVELAKAAIRRAAPFGAITHVQKPWTYNETFLFNDDLKFQLLSLQP